MTNSSDESQFRLYERFIKPVLLQENNFVTLKVSKDFPTQSPITLERNLKLAIHSLLTQRWPVTYSYDSAFLKRLSAKQIAPDHVMIGLKSFLKTFN